MRFQCLFCNFIVHIDDLETVRKNKCPSCDGYMPVFPKTACPSGRVLGDFVIRHKIGRKSSAGIFLAHQISLDRLVTLKVFPKSSSKAEIFLNEARILASLDHPGLVSILAVGEEEGICFIAMDYTEGISLKNYLETNRLIPAAEALHIIQQTAEALHFAWKEKQVIHKDIRPDNIMVSKSGAVKVTGFGFAIAAEKGEGGLEMDMTACPEYKGPEFFSERKTDVRSEIYSLGIIFYQMQTGELPFNGSLESVVWQHLYKEPEKISCRKLKIPEEIGVLLSKMLEKNPEKRHQSLKELIKEIITVRKLIAQDKKFIPLHTVSFRKPCSIRWKLFRVGSGETNLNFVSNVPKFTEKPIFLRRKFQKVGFNSETLIRLDGRRWRHNSSPSSQILLNFNWTKTVERVRRFERELQLG